MSEQNKALLSRDFLKLVLALNDFCTSKGRQWGDLVIDLQSFLPGKMPL